VPRTFGNEAIFTARFTSSGNGIVYSAAKRGSTPRLYTVTAEYPEPREIGDSATQLLSVSSKNEMAVLVRATYVLHRLFEGTLARIPVGGGAPREVLTDVRDADWSPDGAELAVIHQVNGRDRLEYPIGTVLYESFGYLSDPRVSPDGKQIAFHEHAFKFDDRGAVAVVGLDKSHRVLTSEFEGLEGLAWTPDGKRLLFGGAGEAWFYQVFEVGLGGGTRLVLPNAGTVTIQDVSRDGRWLLTRDDMFSRLLGRSATDSAERDLSWLDNSSVPQISRDGELVTFADESEVTYSTLIRKTDGTPAVRLGDGGPLAVSPDKQWVVSRTPSAPQQLMLYPTGAGATRRLDAGELETNLSAAFFPDGKRLFLCGKQHGHAPRCYTRTLTNRTLTPVTPEGVTLGMLSPDGRQVVGLSAESGVTVYSLDGRPPRPVRGIDPGETVIRFSPDSRGLWVGRMRELPVRVERLDLATGARSAVVSLMPPPQIGLLMVNVASIADDPRAHVYVVNVRQSRVFELKGMR
jgi:eukaryotic-like serine/threonine-protein kinase